MKTWEHIFLIDTSRSMAPVHADNSISECIQGIIKTFRTWPRLCELVVISIYTYNESVSCIFKKKSLFELTEISKFICENKSNLKSGIDYLKSTCEAISLKKDSYDYLPTLTIFTGIYPSESFTIEDLEFLRDNFAVGTGIEDFVKSPEDPNWNWRNSPIIATSRNLSVQEHFKRHFERVYSYENIDEFVNMYTMYANE